MSMIVRRRERRRQPTVPAVEQLSPGDRDRRSGSGRSSTPLITVNTAVLAPMPSASVTIATSANPAAAAAGERRSGGLEAESHAFGPVARVWRAASTLVLSLSKGELRAGIRAAIVAGRRASRFAEASAPEALRHFLAVASSRQSIISAASNAMSARGRGGSVALSSSKVCAHVARRDALAQRVEARDGVRRRRQPVPREASVSSRSRQRATTRRLP